MADNLIDNFQWVDMDGDVIDTVNISDEYLAVAVTDNFNKTVNTVHLDYNQALELERALVDLRHERDRLRVKAVLMAIENKEGK